MRGDGRDRGEPLEGDGGFPRGEFPDGGSPGGGASPKGSGSPEGGEPSLKGAESLTGFPRGPQSPTGSLMGSSGTGPKQPHAGNETVNHHLDDQGPDGLDSDELELRRLLHTSVQDLGPRDGTLDHLRRAVPARRARKRQAVIGVAASVLLAGTAIPALWHVSGADSDTSTSMAGQSARADGSSGGGKGPDGGNSGKADGSEGQGTGKDSGTPKGSGEGKGTGSGASEAASGGPAASADGSAAPACTAAQLGSATSSVDGPDSSGVVYGTFRVVNTSGKSCSVAGDVALTAVAQGAADQSKTSVTAHTAGDAAAALPDPSLYVTQLLLAPGSAYDVKFAWVPATACSTSGSGTSGSGGDTGASPSPSVTPSEDASSGGGSQSSSSGVTTQLVTESGVTTATGSVAVTYTADAGGPVVSATVADACAGTVYRTGVVAAS